MKVVDDEELVDPEDSIVVVGDTAIKSVNIAPFDNLLRTHYNVEVFLKF